MQDGMHLVLDPRAVPDDLVAACHLTPHALGVSVGQPNFRQEVRRPQGRKYAGVDLVGLHLRIGDDFDLCRVGYDHPRDMRLKRPYDRHGIAGRLDDDFVLLVQRAPKALEARSRHIHPPGGAELARFPDYHLRERAVDVHADHASHHVLPVWRCGTGASGQHDNYGSALAAQPGRSQGRPATNTSSRLIL